jgi:hypothetical protein
MKRIFQGRITRVETLASKDGNGKPQDFFDWQSAPWQQGLFQNAVNSEIAVRP